MLSRLFTALVAASFIFLVLYLKNFWFFASVIFLVCIVAYYEWISNKFNNKLFGFLLIFNFGFWSIYWIWDPFLAYEFEFYGFFILNTAVFDTFAYIIGSNFGKTFISKKISPNKTLEGLIGGLFSTVLLGMIILFNYFDFLMDFVLLLLILSGGLFAFLGDLLISYFKRQAGVKDTGTILPGHGGVLDRIDSHLIATPLLIIIFSIWG